MPDRAEWQIDRLDLAAYLDRIGVPRTATLTPDEPTLTRLHRAHVLTIPFENVDIVLGRPVSLDLDAVQAKLVHARRGGYCYEHGVLFAAVLQRLGFPVRRLSGRIRMGSAEIRARTHVALLVGEPGRGWLADVGLGSAGPIGPVRWSDGARSDEGRWHFRLDRSGGTEWVLRTAHPGGWFDLYSVDPTPQHLVDYQVGHHYVSTHPDSPFAHRFAAGTSSPRRRLRLSDRCCTTETTPGVPQTTTLDDQEFRRVLTTEIGIALPPADLLTLSDLTRGATDPGEGGRSDSRADHRIA